MANLIGEFDKNKVLIENDVQSHSYTSKTAWYDVTEIVKNLNKSLQLSALDYISRIEAEICIIYDDEEDMNSFVQNEYEDIIDRQLMQLGIFVEGDSLQIRNDARRIRLTFLNGGSMEFANSEWGNIFLSNDTSDKA